MRRIGVLRLAVYGVVFPFPDGRVTNRALGGDDLEAAFEPFVSHWTSNLGAVGEWHGNALIGRVIPFMGNATCHLRTGLEEFGV